MEESALIYLGLVTPYGVINFDNIGSGNGLMPEGTKSLPEPKLTHQYVTLSQISQPFLPHNSAENKFVYEVCKMST